MPTFERAQAMVGDAVSIFHKAIASIEEANSLLVESAKDHANEADILRHQMEQAKINEAKNLKVVEENKKLIGRFSEFVG
jgi:cell shape-determining protein MreC